MTISDHIFTFQDMVEYIWESMNPSVKPPSGRELRVAKAAVISAYRDLANRHQWNYHKRRTLVRTEAYYNTGTIAYDHTGGVNERQLTLTDGTWPANASYGVVVISHVHYPVESRISDTVVTLGSAMNPGSDVSASTAYTWYRDTYPLPSDFRNMLTIIESTSGGDTDPLIYLDAGSHLYGTRYESGNVTDSPDWYTIRSDGDNLGYLSIVFGRAPSQAKTYDMIYMITPRSLKTYKSSAGTVAVTGGATTVTGTGTAFSSSMVGSIIRFSSDGTTEPTSVIGNVNGDDNPYLAQCKITAVASATSLTVDSSPSASDLSGVKYVISDPIDVEPIVMRSPFESLCLYHFARITKRKDASSFAVDFAENMAYAMEQDRRVRVVQTGQLVDFAETVQWGTVDVTP